MRLVSAFLIISALCAPSWARDLTRYASGKWHLYRADTNTKPSRDAVQNFLREKFPTIKGLIWKKKNAIRDARHTHFLYELWWEGIPVEGHFVKLGLSHAGIVDYATSLWEHPWEANVLSRKAGEILDRRQETENFVWSELQRRFESFTGQSDFTPVWWVDPTSLTLVPAYKVRLQSWKDGFYREWIVGGGRMGLIEERSLMRFYDAGTKNVYLKSPLGMGAAFDTATIDNLDSNSTLSNSFIHVYRDENNGGGDPLLQEIDPDTDYTADGEFSLSPTDVNYKGTTCVSCANQNFEGVNNYYHLTQFRQYLDTVLSAIGASSTVSGLLSDPLAVIINSLSYDFNGDGVTTNDTNNAAYISAICRDGMSTSFLGCLAILRPASIPTTACTGALANIQFFHLAREANVVVHEYQHYLTDRITNMIPGSLVQVNVGDMLHEGYSDYFGASQVSRLAGTNATSVGEYAFQNCSPVIRDVATLRPFENSVEEKEDSHIGGLTWASGLWQLRTLYGAQYADRLATQSLLYLSPRPGFLEAVESLVQADLVVGTGSRGPSIRTLFYNTLSFTGGVDINSIFRDPENGIVDVGLHSCLGVEHSGRGPHALWVTGLFLLWLGGLLCIGRRARR